MRALFLNLGSNPGSVACVTEEAAVAAQEVDHRISDGELVPLVTSLLESAGWSKEELTHVACVTGPGGFTSLRVGVGFANALGFALRIPVAGVHLSEVFAARVPASLPSLVWLHSTKRDQTFVRGFGSAAQRFPEPVLAPLDALIPALAAGDQWMGELIPAHEQAVAAVGAERATLAPLEGVLPKLVADLAYGSETIVPWYGRGW